MSSRTALVVGATGLTGRNTAEHLAASGWEVYGISRHPPRPTASGRSPGDVLDPDSVTAVAEQVRATHLFYCTWLRQDTEDAATSRSTAPCCGTSWTRPEPRGPSSTSPSSPA